MGGGFSAMGAISPLFATPIPTNAAVPISDGSGSPDASLDAWVSSGSGGVSTVSVVSANGFAGSVADPMTTPAITVETTVTGILYGDGMGVSPAVAGDFPTLNQNTTGSAGSLSATLVPTQGGTGIAAYTTGDILYASASNVLSKLAAGTDTYVLTMTAGVPVWAASAGGGGSPGGSNTQLQYNNSSAFGGISGATSNGTKITFASNAFEVSNIVGTGQLSIASLTGNNLALLAGSGQISFGKTSASVDQSTGVQAGLAWFQEGGTPGAAFNMRTADTTFSSGLYLSRTRGTLASPSAMSSGDRLGGIYFGGYTSSGSINSFVCSFFAETTEAWSTNCGAKMVVNVCPIGSGTARQVAAFAATSSTAASWTSHGDIALVTGSTTSLTLTSTTAVFVGTIATAAPAGASAHPWLLGSVVSGAVTLDAANSVYVDINGSVVKFLIAA